MGLKNARQGNLSKPYGKNNPGLWHSRLAAYVDLIKLLWWWRYVMCKHHASIASIVTGHGLICLTVMVRIDVCHHPAWIRFLPFKQSSSTTASWRGLVPVVPVVPYIAFSFCASKNWSKALNTKLPFEWFFCERDCLIKFKKVGKHLGVSKNRGTPKWMVYNGKPY